MSSPGGGCSAHVKQLCDNVYLFHEPQEQPQVEVVFIHGLELDGSKYSYWTTWLARDGSQDNCWPVTWLAEEFPQSRILSLSYDANAMQTPESGRMDPYTLGESLVQQMTLPSVGIGQHDCPVVFVCHSFGGLIAKQIVVTGYHSFQQDKEVQKLLRNIKSYYFYATPHSGTKLADLAAWIPFVPKASSLTYLKVLSPQVGRLNSEFEQIQREVYNNECWFFAVGEMNATSHGGVVVSEASARHVGYKFLPVSANHIDICRPMSKTDTSFLHLTQVCIAKVIQYHRDKRHRLETLPQGLVGIEGKKDMVCKILEKFSIVGVVGMGGIGKTTVSKYVYNSQGMFYERTCFLQDVRSRDVASVQKQLLHELCGEVVGNADYVGKIHLESIQQCIMKRRVLVVIDDVGNSETLKSLQVPAFHFGNSGSKVIVTSRNRQILESHVTSEGITNVKIMEVELLDANQAEELFCHYAFTEIDDEDDEDDEMKDLKNLAVDIVKACCGLPLSLEVIGKYLRKQNVHPAGERKEIWEDALRRLSEAEPLEGGDDNEILWKRLKISYDDLRDDAKSMFLDFACLFCSKSSEFPLYHLSEQSIGWIWKSPIGLQNLIERSLIKVSEIGEIGKEGRSLTMHDQLRDMGRKLVKDSSMKESLHVGLSLKNMTRLWEFEQIQSFFEENKSSTTLQSLAMLNWDTIELPQSQLQSGPKQFFLHESFPSLRLLDLFYSDAEVVEFCLRKCWKELNWLCLDRTLIDELHHIEMVGFFTGLRVLQMRDCENLKELPASISNLVHLLELDLTGCKSLRSLPNSIGHLKLLKRFQLAHCKALEEIPAGVGQLPCLQYLGIHSCTRLLIMCEFESKRDNLYHLDLSGTSNLRSRFKSLGKLHRLRTLKLSYCRELIIYDPSKSFGQLSRLEKLELEDCFKLVPGLDLEAFDKLLPKEAETMWNMITEKLCCRHLQELCLPAISQAGLPACPALKVLELSNGLHLEELPASLGGLTQLKKLTVDDTSSQSLKKLPDSLSNLVRLEVLELYSVRVLDGLPEWVGHLSSLQRLVIVGVRKMEELPASVGQLSQLQTLYLADCVNMKRLPDCLSRLPRLYELKLVACSSLVELPASLGQLSELKTLEVDCKNLLHLPGSLASLPRLSQLSLIWCNKLQVTEAGQQSLLRVLEQRGCNIDFPFNSSLGTKV